MTEKMEHRLGNYHLGRIIGSGAFADVYLGTHIYLNMRVAFKVLRTHINTHTVESFRNEARQLGQLMHPHIIRVLDFGIEDEVPFLIMDYAPDGNLRQRHPEGTVVPLSTVRSYVTTIASALQYTHDQHLIHRDLKPENLLVGSQHEILLSDFGLALISHSIDTLQVQKHFGTLAYMAPEQIEGQVCSASDQYALAIMTYEWLVGRRPFEGTATQLVNQHLFGNPAPLHEQLPELPPRIEQVLFKALSKDPAQRYKNVRSFAETFDEACQSASSFSPLSDVSEVPFIEVSETDTGPHSLQVRIQHLPMPLTPLIGRELELQLASSRLLRPEVRLLTLIGFPGVGKTRLALDLAAQIQDVFADGVCFVSLASINDPGLFIPTLRQALGLSENVHLSPFEHLVAYLREKHLLLLLDNFEQLPLAASRLAEVLSVCPQLKILVTSRAPLYLQGEYELTVPPLATPDLQQLPATEDLAHVSSVALFVERVEALKPGFKLTSHNGPLIAELCTRLGGVPLAIELAATRSKHLSLEALLSRLQQGLEVLTGGKQNAPTRQQTLHNAISWSYSLLSSDEQALFRHLCIFVGKFTLEDAEAVHMAAGKLSISVMDGVASLVDKCLLQQYQVEEHEPRLYLLEIIRSYGLEQLAQLGELEDCLQTYATYYLALVEQHEENLHPQEQIVWLRRVESVYENIRVTLQWFLEHHKIEATFRLLIALRQFWFLRGHLTEGRRFLEQAIEASTKDSIQNASPLQAKALYVAGYLAACQQDLESATRQLKASLELFRRQENKGSIAACLARLGFIEYMRGEGAKGKAKIDKSLTLSQEIGDKRNSAEIWHFLGVGALFQGQYTEARKQLEKSLALYQAEYDGWGTAANLHYLGLVSYARKDFVHARHFTEESLELMRMLDEPYGTSDVLTVLASESTELGEITYARSLLEEAELLARTHENREDQVRVLCGVALLELRQNHLAEARACLEKGLLKMQGRWFDPRSKWELARCMECLGESTLDAGYATWTVQFCSAAETVRGAHGYYCPLGREQASYERTLEQARNTLGEKAFAAAWLEGQEMTSQKVSTAKITSPLPEEVHLSSQIKEQPVAIPALPAGLTAREVEVLRILAKGMSNNQIAEQLVLSPYTVNSHTQSIYSKLNVNSRSAATRFAVEHNLL